MRNPSRRRVAGLGNFPVYGQPQVEATPQRSAPSYNAGWGDFDPDSSAGSTPGSATSYGRYIPAPETPSYQSGEFTGVRGGAPAAAAAGEYVAAPGGENYPAAAAAAEYLGFTPKSWKEPNVAIPEAGVDTRKVVDSTRHYLDENMQKSFADAARRMGALGGLVSTGYAGKIGEAERARDRDLAGLYYKYDYDAAQQDASRKAAARENMLQRAFGGWGKEQDLLAGEAARHTGFNVGQQDRADAYNRSKYGAESSEAARRTAYNVGQQDRADAISGRNYGYDAAEAARKTAFDTGEASRETAFNWDKYGADLSEAQRRQIWEQLRSRYGS
jgi:hypothetical protein